MKSIFSIEELISVAKSNDPIDTPTGISKRELKDIETFICDMGIKVGRKTIHNLVVFDLYKLWAKDTALELKEFKKAFSYYFPVTKDVHRNDAYKLSTTHKQGKFNPSKKHIEELRNQYGQKKSKQLKGESCQEKLLTELGKDSED